MVQYNISGSNPVIVELENEVKKDFSNVFSLVKLSGLYLLSETPEKAFERMKKVFRGSKCFRKRLESILAEGMPLEAALPFYTIVGAGLDREPNYYSTHHEWKNKNPAYPQRYLDVRLFSEGLAVAEDEDGFFHIKPDGLPAYEARFRNVNSFVEGLAAVMDKPPVPRPRMDHVTNLTIDLLSDIETGEWCHIKPDGTIAYPQRYERVGDFSEGLANAMDKTGWLHINKDGTPAYNKRYDWTYPFSEGLATARDKKGSLHINRKGNPIYGQRYKGTWKFSEGLARVKDENGYFHIRKDGTPAYEQRFGVTNDFSEGFAAVRMDGKGWYHIKPDGTPLYDERYWEAFDFRDGVAVVRKTFETIRINKEGKIIDVNY